MHDEREQHYVDHSIKKLLAQRVFQIAVGYEDCNDCKDLREDMIFESTPRTLFSQLIENLIFSECDK